MKKAITGEFSYNLKHFCSTQAFFYRNSSKLVNKIGKKLIFYRSISNNRKSSFFFFSSRLI